MNDSASAVTPLLSYALAVDPDPLRASPRSGPTQTARLTIVVSNSTSEIITVSSITFSFALGPNAKDFASGTTGIDRTPPQGWSLTRDGSTFTAEPKTPSSAKIGRDGLSFTISDIQVNDQPGLAELNVKEVTADDTGERTGTTDLALLKFPAGFAVGPLQATPANIVAGGSTTLTWSASTDASCVIRFGQRTISHPKGAPNEPLPPVGSFTITDLQDTTPFTLVATADVDGQQRAVERQFTVTATDQTPQIITFVALPGRASLGGNVKLIWTTKYVNSCELWSDNASRPLQVAASSAGYEVAPHLPTTYKLVASGADPMQNAVAETTVESSYTPGFTLATGHAPWPALVSGLILHLNGLLHVIDYVHGAVYSSSDGAHWTVENTAAPWANRGWTWGASAVVFQNRLWVIGENKPGYLWSSADGKTWTQPKFGPMLKPQTGQVSVVFEDKVWVIGGAGSPAVWSSPDGGTWTRETNANLPQLIRPAAAVYGGKIWLLGGDSATGQVADAQAWSSVDGTTWTAEPTPPWSARFASTAVVVGDALWLIGGDVLPQSSSPTTVPTGEIWTMSDPASPVWTKSALVSPVENSPILTRGFGASPNVVGGVAADNVLWLCGGLTDHGQGTQRAVYRYIIPPPYDQPLRGTRPTPKSSEGKSTT